jgi:hypothetical protein
MPHIRPGVDNQTSSDTTISSRAEIIFLLQLRRVDAPPVNALVSLKASSSAWKKNSEAQWLWQPDATVNILYAIVFILFFIFKTQMVETEFV